MSESGEWAPTRSIRPDLRAIDMNLLLVLEALLEEGTVTGAGRRLGLSQPATSAALGRLREIFSDELLVRSGGRMRPTPRARALRESLRDSLANLETLVSDRARFDPATIQSEVRICVTDYGLGTVVVPLLRRLSEVAPNVRVNARPAQRGTVQESLQSGEFDFAVGVMTGMDETQIGSRMLHEEELGFLVDEGHPAARSATEGRVRQEDLLEHPVVTFAQYRERGSIAAQLLATTGVSLNVVHRVMQQSVFPSLVRGTSLLGLSGRNFLDSLPESMTAGLVFLRPPSDPVRVPIGVFWNRWSESDPLLTFVREQLDLLAGEGEPQRRGAAG